MGKAWKKLDVKGLNKVIESRKYIMTKKTLSERLGMTENGLHYAITKESIRLTTFQQLCELLMLSPIELFRGDQSEEMFVQEKENENYSNEKYIKHLENEVEYLRDLNSKLMITIDRQYLIKEKMD